MTDVFDDRRCELGEGPLWHPQREQLFWFDILGKRLLTRGADGPQEWHFSDHVSAAGWIDENRLLIASETALFRFDLATGARHDLCLLEADRPGNRSNDGRADPQGGFWIGTMGKKAEPGAGAIYRFYRGSLRRLFAPLTITNTICFAPDGTTAYFADTAAGQVMRVALDADGWPVGEPSVFLDLRSENLNPDGAVIDTEGRMWLAEWGSARVSVYGPNGVRAQTVAVPAGQSSCPAFGGPDLSTLFVTSALQGMDDAARAAEPMGGMTFRAATTARGQREHQVIL